MGAGAQHGGADVVGSKPRAQSRWTVVVAALGAASLVVGPVALADRASGGEAPSSGLLVASVGTRADRQQHQVPAGVHEVF
ncbi:hypothetical protein B7486_71415, partial [cyanobacterium TDX16]